MRLRIFCDHAFIRLSIRFASAGVLKWTGHKVALDAKVGGCFISRNEK
jgi:hypothetical protein